MIYLWKRCFSKSESGFHSQSVLHFPLRDCSEFLSFFFFFFFFFFVFSFAASLACGGAPGQGATSHTQAPVQAPLIQTSTWFMHHIPLHGQAWWHRSWACFHPWKTAVPSSCYLRALSSTRCICLAFLGKHGILCLSTLPPQHLPWKPCLPMLDKRERELEVY